MATIPLPDRGLLTFDAEGTEGGRFHSRKPHVPSPGSGLTIGRGYDIAGRNRAKAQADLTRAGLSDKDAAALAAAVGLRGAMASEFIARNNLKDFEITPQQQKVLFEITYAQAEADLVRIATSADVRKKTGKFEWASVHP